MKFVFGIIGVMLGLDVVWWLLATRLASGTRWRWVAVAFIAAQVLGLVLLIGGRIAGIHTDRIFPRAVLSVVYLWHFFGLTIFIPLALLAALGLAAIRMGKGDPAPNDDSGVSRRQFLGNAVVFVPPLFTVGLTGLALAQLRGFRIRRFTLSVPALPRELDGLTITHVSDMHVGAFTRGQIVDDVVTATNELDSDLVCVTGDLINSDLADLPEGIRALRAMKARYGVWNIEGNHDLIDDGAEFERQMRASGLNFLLDESSTITIAGLPVQILGLRWVGRVPEGYDQAVAEAVRKLLRQRQPDAFPIFLSHHPIAFDAAVEAGLPLVLAGHTHGGQVMLNEAKGFGPTFFRYWSGLYQRAGSQMIVSNGVGNWFPVRVNAPAEIAQITLKAV